MTMTACLLQEFAVIHLFRPLRAGPAPGPRLRTSALPTASIDDDAKACGWFDSSHELRQGLWVQEHAAGDSLPAELPLADWLTLNLWSNPVTLAS
jgi:hypothetical protein